MNLPEHIHKLILEKNLFTEEAINLFKIYGFEYLDNLYTDWINGQMSYEEKERIAIIEENN